MNRRRQAVLLLVASVGATACGVGDGTAEDAVLEESGGAAAAYHESAAREVMTEQVPASPRDDRQPSGLDSYAEPHEELGPPSIDLGVLRSGGPAPDGIPSIDDPSFHAASTVDYLEADAPVIALEIDGDARAYPLEILVWHEVVNDTVGGVPVSVAYCPLCNSVTVYEREIEGAVLDFGVSGLLYNSSLVMYDRQTETLWSHFTGEPLYGALSDADLVSVPASIVGFDAWQSEHSDGLVLNRETGASREYGLNPYPGYDDVDSDPFLFEGEIDGRYTAMTRVVGVESGEAAAAFPLLDLRTAGVMTGAVGDEDVVAFWTPGSSSALDRATVSGGVDVGATGVFSPVIDGEELTFSASTELGVVTIRDEETGSTWNVFGEAVAGELAGTRLEQFVHIDTFWFAWIAFHPNSDVVT